jgi:hypothetical protein
LEYPQKETEMPKEDINEVFSCAEFNSDVYSMPGPVVGEELKPKLKNSKLEMILTSLSQEFLSQKETEMPNGDGSSVLRCAESICNAYIRPGSLVVEQ